ncbi:hypothetical protein PM082_009495 [Marasmius tenuissimus]|nr:hypothetical protein PM082_009495 [Marasmius tenuissimus]
MSTETFNLRDAVQQGNNRRLPLEILHNIFSLCSRSTFNLDECPWVLTHVCRLWRAVAISEPKLWASIDIDFLEIYDSDIDPTNYSSILETVLERTKTTPLHVRITLSMDVFEAGDELVASLGPHAHRVVSLEYVADSGHLIQQVPTISLSEGGFEALERLRYQLPRRADHRWLDCWGVSPGTIANGAVSFLRSVINAAPQLHEISMSSCSYAIMSLYTSLLHPSSLTHLSILACSEKNAEDCIAEILHHCFNLDTLIMDHVPFTINQVTLLPKLQTLVVYGCSQNIDFLQAPSLQNLTVSGYADFVSMEWMVESSNCRLKSITVVNFPLDKSKDVEAFLRSVGAEVVTLTLQGLVLGHLFNRIGDTSSQDTLLLPRLRTIRVVQRWPGWEQPSTGCWVHVQPSKVCPSIPSLLRAAQSRLLLSVEVEIYGDSPYLEMVSPEELRRMRTETGILVGVKVLRSLLQEGHMLERLSTLVVERWRMQWGHHLMEETRIRRRNKRARDLSVFKDILQTMQDFIRLDNPRDIDTKDLLITMQALLSLEQIPEVDKEELQAVKERASTIVKWVDSQKPKD